MLDNRPLVLWGPPCAGKSTIAARCAALLGWEYIDLDLEIVRRTGVSISDLFTKGEAHFREIEGNLAKEILKQQTVISLGGGTLLEPALRALYQTETRLIRLTASFDTLLARSKHQKDRPLLQENPQEKLLKLLEDRRSIYEEIVACAETEHGASVEHVADRVLQLAFGQQIQQAKLGTKEHDLILGPGVLGDVGTRIAALGAKEKVFVFADRRAAAHHGARLKRSLAAAGLRWEWVSLPAGEAQKTSTVLWRLLRLLAREGADKGSFIIGLGGGATCDLSALVASLYMRGLPLTLVPTTALSMVDASLGGKTAINEWGVKNIIGTFYPPKLVVSDTTTLSSLPLRERRSALAEVIKIALIKDETLLQFIESNAVSLVSEKADALLWNNVVARAAQQKLEVIAEDFEENGPRKHLNLGHTLGHALEANAKDLTHGEAVGLGLLAMLRISVAKNLCDQALLSRVMALLSSLRLPTEPPKIAKERLLRSLTLDKKNKNKKLSFIACREVGRTEIVQDVTATELLRVL